MCRILGKIGNLEVSEQTKIIGRFQELSHTGCVPKGDPKGHRDGWGVVFYKHGKAILYEKKPTDAFKDADFNQLKKEITQKKLGLFLAHLRKASVGSRTLRNTQPYLYLDFSFVHNGTIFNSEKIKLQDRLTKLRKGSTDSEKLFLLIIQNIQSKRRGSSIIGAIKKAVEDVRKELNYTAMNMLLTNGKKMWAIREINEKNEEVQILKMEKYYELYIGKSKRGDGVVFSSEKISKSLEWKLINNHEVIEAELVKEKVSIVSMKI